MNDVQVPSHMLRPTFARIHLQALRHNFQLLASLLPKKVGIMGMVKADAYGHGAVAVSKELERYGAVSLGVATAEEGVELRSAGIRLPILVMGGMLGRGEVASRCMIEERLTPVLHSAQAVEILEHTARALRQNIVVHLKIDTGMGRLGVMPDALPSVLERLRRSPSIRIEGLMTHFAIAGDVEYTAKQLDQFMVCCRQVMDQLGNRKIIFHASNSAGILCDSVAYPEDETWWARPGLALYGSSGGVALSKGKGLEPVMSLVSSVALIKTVPEGMRISYEGLFTTKRKTRIAVIPIGYADGYPWRLTGKSHGLINGLRAPVVGRVTMDMVILDVTDIAASVGDEVILMGSQRDEVITVDQFAEWAGTIPYEIMCGISNRMPRVYDGCHPERSEGSLLST